MDPRPAQGNPTVPSQVESFLPNGVDNLGKIRLKMINVIFQLLSISDSVSLLPSPLLCQQDHIATRRGPYFEKIQVMRVWASDQIFSGTAPTECTVCIRKQNACSKTPLLYMDSVLVLTSISVNTKHGFLFQNSHDYKELLLSTF